MQLRAGIQDLEERAFNAWPSAHTLIVGGWLLRLSYGYTKRANSASALATSVPINDVRSTIEQLFNCRSLPPTFRLTPLASPDVEDKLRDAGYDLIDPNLVMTMAIERGSTPTNVRIVEVADPDWMTGFAKATLLDDRDRELHRAIISAISLPAAFVTVLEDDEPVGFGLGVYERASIGIFDVVVMPNHRSQGYGRTVTQALLGWGSQVGAASAYLQVGEHNRVARRLYENLGFSEAYRYHYRRLMTQRS